MTLNRLFRILSGSGASWSVPGVDAGAATEGWQDKRAHVALRSDGCFYLGFWRAAHVAAFLRTVRHRPIPSYFRDIPHVARRRHGR